MLIKSSLVVLVALSSAAVLAQEASIKPNLAIKAVPLKIDIATVPAVASTARQSTITHRAQVAATQPLQAGALSSFSLHFHNGDHKIRHIQVLQRGGKAEAVFADQNSDDPFAFEASWYQGNYRLAEVTGLGGGEFDIPLPSAPLGHVPVLGGFAFQRKDGSDANLRTIGVRIAPDSRSVRVTLVDDQGSDFRGFERTVAMGFLMSMVPFGQVEATTLTAAQGTSRMLKKEFANNGMRQYHATVQIAWVPKAALAGPKSVSSGSRAIEGGMPPKAAEKVALTGFLFHFANSDHHLLTLGVHLSNQEAVKFQDNDRDDPIQWYADYVTLK